MFKCSFRETILLLRNLTTSSRTFYSSRRNILLTGRASSLRHSSSQIRSKEALEKVDDAVSFQDMLSFRVSQALSTVLIELSSKDDTARVVALCKDFGNVRQHFAYSGELGSEFILTEFANVAVARKFLKACQFKNTTDAYPLWSRLLRYEGRKQRQQPAVPPSVFPENTRSEHKNTPVSPCQLSQAIEDAYRENKLSDLSIRKRFLFCCMLHDALEGMFPQSAVFPFGSSINSFGTEGCDLDLVVRLYPEKVNNNSEFFFQTKTFAGDSRVLQQRAVSCIYEILRTFVPGVGYIQKVLHARVPILKFKHKILELDCDVSVNNINALFMSEILYFFGHLDSRVHPLVFAVKNWAKEANITYETPGSWITNFSLTLLVIFFLQNRPQPILPPLSKAVVLTGSLPVVQYLEKSSVWKKLAKRNKESLAALLEEFLVFLATFPFKTKTLCIISGQASDRDDGYPIWIRYPLEEDKNVSKNVSQAELQRLCDLAGSSAKFLEAYLNSEDAHKNDLSTALGLPFLKQLSSHRIDVSELYSNDARVS